MERPRFVVTDAVLSLDAVMTAVLTDADRPLGAVATFVGLVRGINLGRRGAVSSVRGVRAARHPGLLERIVGEARDAWPGIRRRAPPDRPARDRRGQRRDRGRLGAPGRRVCGLPLRDRAREADRADLEARALRRRRRLARRAPRPTRTTRRRAGGAYESHARDGPSLRAASRSGGLAASSTASRPTGDRRDVWESLVAESRRWRRTNGRCRWPSTPSLRG